MKKFTILLLVALLALPMMAQNTAVCKADFIRDQKGRVDEQGTIKPIKAFDWVLLPAPQTRAEGLLVWDFEEDADYESWMSLDSDGDGYGWEIENYYAHSGSYSLTSRSYYGGALDPDNWLISPKVTLGGVMSLWAMNYMSSWPDKFAVYVCIGDPTSLDDFVKISDDIAPPTSWAEYTFDLSEYADQEGCFAIRHYDSYDNYRVFIDYITMTANVPDTPENLSVNPGSTTADVTWEDNENTAWNLRYRELAMVEGAEKNLFWDFEEDTEDNTNIELTGGWTCIDADGDGNEWYHLYGVSGLQTHSGTGHVTSASYNGEGLNPDNWLISPEVELDGTLSFWACGQDPSYADEVFAVYVSTGDPTDVSTFTAISEDITATGEMTEYTFDLSSYAGQMGYVAIRHYDTYDMFRLNVDDIAITYVEAPESEWIYVNDLDETSYTLDGLTPETTYEVQVQGNDGEETRGLSSWTESVVFTTLAAEEETVYYVLGFNDWNNPIEITEEGATITATTQDLEDENDTAQEFKIVTAAEDGGWIWYGGEDANGAGFFDLTDWMDSPITLYDDPAPAVQNFRLPEAGTYTIKLVADRAALEGLKMIVTKEEDITGIDTIKSEVKGDNNYYNLMGQKMNGNNLPAGIYIHNGKKVVIK